MTFYTFNMLIDYAIENCNYLLPSGHGLDSCIALSRAFEIQVKDYRKIGKKHTVLYDYKKLFCKHGNFGALYWMHEDFDFSIMSPSQAIEHRLNCLEIFRCYVIDNGLFTKY